MSPVRHSECRRTSGARSARCSPITSATCSRVSSGLRKATIRASSAAATGSLERVAIRRREASVNAARSPTFSVAGSAAPEGSTRKAGRIPAIRARSSATRACSAHSSASALNGPFSGLCRSSAGSATASAAGRSKPSAPRSRTGVRGTAASRWLASFSVAARLADTSMVSPETSENAVSTGCNSGAPSIASGQPWRSASTACAARREGDGSVRG